MCSLHCAIHTVYITIAVAVVVSRAFLCSMILNMNAIKSQIMGLMIVGAK